VPYEVPGYHGEDEPAIVTDVETVTKLYARTQVVAGSSSEFPTSRPKLEKQTDSGILFWRLF